MSSRIRNARSDQTSGRRRWYALALLVMAQFVVVLDGAIVFVALPSIKTHLHFSTPNLQYVVTAYAITFGGLLLLAGRLSDRLGRRRLLIAGVALFTVASLLDGIATSPGELIAFRALQGIGAALLTPAALSLLVTMFTEARERNLALGIWGAAAATGGAAGLLLGGALTSGLSWRWIFFINVPVGVAAALLSPVLLRESRAEGAARTFDFAGAGSITGGLMLLVYGLTRASQHGWGNGATVGLLAGAAALVGAFVAIEWRSREPLLPLRLFRLRTVSGSNLAILVVAGSSQAVFVLATLYFQVVEHRVVPNSLDRFNLNSHSPLQHEIDGSLKIAVGPQPVPGVPDSNWLPSAAGKRFTLTFRTYVPKSPALRGDWTPPPLQQIKP